MSNEGERANVTRVGGKQGSDKESSYHAEDLPSSEGERNDEELITNHWLSGLGFEALLRSGLPLKKNLKNTGSREIEIWYTTRAEACYLSGVSRPDSPPVPIMINALKAIALEELDDPA